MIQQTKIDKIDFLKTLLTEYYFVIIPYVEHDKHYIQYFFSQYVHLKQYTKFTIVVKITQDDKCTVIFNNINPDFTELLTVNLNQNIKNIKTLQQFAEWNVSKYTTENSLLFQSFLKNINLYLIKAQNVVTDGHSISPSLDNNSIHPSLYAYMIIQGYAQEYIDTITVNRL